MAARSASQNDRTPSRKWSFQSTQPTGEAPRLPAAVAHVPGLGDQLYVRQHRIRRDGNEERVPGIEFVGRVPAERHGKVEAEAVDVELVHPVPEGVQDQLHHAGFAEIQAVPAAGGVQVPAVAICPVILVLAKAAEAQGGPSGPPSAVWL